MVKKRHALAGIGTDGEKLFEKQPWQTRLKCVLSRCIDAQSVALLAIDW
jgi:hypothetical protein